MPTIRDSKITNQVVSGSFRAMRLMETWIGRRSSRSIASLSSLRRFLFLEYGTALGSNVHASPMFEGLKRAVPDAVVTVACSRMGFEVFRQNPFIDYLIETPRPSSNAMKAIRALRKHLKETEFSPEIVITSKGNEPRGVSMLAFSAGEAIRLGYTYAPELFDYQLHADMQRSLIDNNLKVIERLGHERQPVEPRVGFGPDDLQYAKALLARLGQPEGAPRVVFITQTSPTQRKSWPADRFVAVANHVTKALGAAAIFVGTGKEKQGIETIRSLVKGSSLSLAGETSISQLAAVLSLCDYAITLDTGNMHIARSVGLPMVILAPAWQPVIEWLPLGFDQYRIFKGDDIPKAPPDYVMDEMGVEEVIAAVDELFERYPASTESREARVARSLAHIDPRTRRVLA